MFSLCHQEAVQIVREAVETRLTQALTAGKSNQSTGKGNQTAGRGNQTQSIGKSNQPSSAIITG